MVEKKEKVNILAIETKDMTTVKRIYTWYKDSSFWSLLLVNGYVIATVQRNAISAINVMLIFWIQSVIIGIFAAVQMLIVKDFLGDGDHFDLKRQKLEKKEKILQTAFFVGHYGFFHAGYCLFILMLFRRDGMTIDWKAVLPFALTFFAHHLFSFIRSRKNLAKADPESIMGQAYGRIVPMHAGIIIGAFNPIRILMPFLFIKAAIDLLAHSSKQNVITAQDLKKPIHTTTPEKARRNVYVVFIFVIVAVLGAMVYDALKNFH